MGEEKKTAIVTGGASGLGLAVVEHLASQGHNVAVLDVNADSGNGVVSRLAADIPHGKVIFKKCDVTSWKSQAEAFKEVYTEFGRIDIVLANAGIAEQGLVSMASIEDDEPQMPNLKVMDVDLIGVIYSVKLAVHYMVKNSPTGPLRGSIICTASIAGLYPFPVSPLYATAKTAVAGLVRSTAPIFAKHKIQINALAPSVIETNITEDRDLFKKLIVTPVSTLVQGVSNFLGDPGLSGEVAEIHGQNVTLRPPHEPVDEDTRKNLEILGGLDLIR